MNALGGYLLVSLFFVFGTMIEFSIVLLAKLKIEWDARNVVEGIFISKETLHTKNRKINNATIEVEPRESASTETKTKHEKNARDATKGLFGSLQTTAKVDFIALIMFSLCYFLFNCFYWQHYGTN